jgi:hypothetical protein
MSPDEDAAAGVALALRIMLLVAEADDQGVLDAIHSSTPSQTGYAVGYLGSALLAAVTTLCGEDEMNGRRALAAAATAELQTGGDALHAAMRVIIQRAEKDEG